ncbi:hypothetical protein Tco_0491387 [Tanacetum coccineum]
MSLLQLSNRMNVLTSHLLSYGTEMNIWYTYLASFTTQLQEKVWIKMDQLDKLRSEFYNLKEKNEKAQEECYVRDQENRDLQASNHALSAEVKRLKDQLVEAKATATMSADELVRTNSKLSEQALSDVTRFVSSNFNCLIWKLLSSDEFNAILACIFSLGINSIAEFDKVVADLQSTSFPFLVNIFEAARNTLPEVANLQSDKLAHPAASSSTLATSSLTSKKFGRTSAPKDFEPKRFADEADPSRA